MPVKNVKRRTNDGFEGTITGLTEEEKEIISSSIDKDSEEYVTIDVSDINFDDKQPYKKDVLSQIGDIYNNGHPRSLKLVFNGITIATLKPAVNLLAVSRTDGIIGYTISSLSTYTGVSAYIAYSELDKIYAILIVSVVKYFDTDDVQNMINDMANTKQNTLFIHTITIYEGNTQDGNSICFTTYTSSSTPISSIEQLANTDLNCFGVSGTTDALTFYNKIHIGNDLAITTLQKATGGSVALSAVYAAYTITDDVTVII